MTTALAALPEDETVMQADRDRMEGARQEIAEDYLARNSGWYAKDYAVPNSDAVHVEGLLVGTAEAAAMLGVERPRIGAGTLKDGKLPDSRCSACDGAGVASEGHRENARAGTDARRKPRNVAAGLTGDGLV